MVLPRNSVRPAIALGPAGDALQEAWLGRSNFLQALLKLLPDTRHSEESRRASPLERGHKGALQCIWSCKEDLAHIAEVLQ